VALSIFLSGGSSNASQAASLGGAKSVAAVPTQLFGELPESFFASGITRYRLIYVQTDAALSSLKVFKTETPSPGTTVSFAWALAGVGATEPPIANETTAPAGVTFADATALTSALEAGPVGAGLYRGLWVRLTHAPNTPFVRQESFTLLFDHVEAGAPAPGPAPAPTPAPAAAVIFDAEEFVNASITAASGNASQDRYIRGGNFNTPLFATNTIYQWWELAIVGASLPNPAASYAETTFKTVMGRGGSNLRVMSASLKADSPNSAVEQIRLTEYQTAGLPTSTRVEPVFYQRMWVKFDERTLSRAQRVGQASFYHMFWEVKAEPDYRLRLQLQYDGVKLYWVAATDVLTNTTHIHATLTKDVNVILAPHSSAAGWHKVEVYMNRPAGVWRVAIDGVTFMNLSGANLMGASGNIANFPAFTQNYVPAAMNSGFVNDAPAEILFSGLRLWNMPPADAWSAGTT
jgi:hypothetical protein